MTGRRLPILSAALATGAALLALPNGVLAATCGELPANAGPSDKAPVAALTLNAEQSTTTLKVGRKTKDETLVFVYTLSGCDLPEGTTAAQGRLLPHGDPQLDRTKAFTFQQPTLEGDDLTYEIVVHPKAFDPGKYNLVFKTPGTKLFAKQNATVYVSRSDNSPWSAISAAIVGALIGLALGAVALAAKATDEVTISKVWAVVAVAVAIGAGIYVLRTDYYSDDVEVWSGASAWFKTAADAFLAGSTGALTGILAKIVHVTAKKRRRRRAAVVSGTPGRGTTPGA